MQTLPILWKCDRWDDHLAKLSEEFKELAHEIHDINSGVGDMDKLNSEAMDIIQVALGIIEASGQDIEAVIEKHTDKLMGRGWSVKGWINVEVMLEGVR